MPDVYASLMTEKLIIRTEYIHPPSPKTGDMQYGFIAPTPPDNIPNLGTTTLTSPSDAKVAPKPCPTFELVTPSPSAPDLISSFSVAIDVRKTP